MDLFKAIETRRSVRRFKPQPVPRADLEKLVAAAIEAPSGCNLQLRQYIIVDSPDVLADLRRLRGVTETAPAAIVLLMEPKGSEWGEFWIQDASAAMENMLLAAVAMGYGAVWIEGALRANEDALREALGVGDGLRVWAIMPVGQADEQPDRRPKSAFADVTHYNGFVSRPAAQ